MPKIENHIFAAKMSINLYSLKLKLTVAANSANTGVLVRIAFHGIDDTFFISFSK